MSLFGERARRRGKKAAVNNRALGARAYPSGPRWQVFTVTATGPAREFQQTQLNQRPHKKVITPTNYAP
jgi:hypothetical protein